MAFLRILFTGLCAYVPRQLQTGEPNQGSILLVKTTQTGSGLDQHFPELYLNGTAVNIAGKEIDLSINTPVPSQISYVQPAPTSLPYEPTPNTNEDRDFRWLPAIEQISAANDKLDDTCFDPRPMQVAARVKLTAGWLGAAAVARDENYKSIVWNFADKPSSSASVTHKQALATALSLTAQVQGTSVAVNVRDFGGGNPVTHTVYESGGEILIVIQNLCVGCEVEKQFLEDFGWFYDLCKQPIYTRHVPSLPAGGGLTDTYCPPARFSTPHPKA